MDIHARNSEDAFSRSGDRVKKEYPSQSPNVVPEPRNSEYRNPTVNDMTDDGARLLPSYWRIKIDEADRVTLTECKGPLPSWFNDASNKPEFTKEERFPSPRVAWGGPGPAGPEDTTPSPEDRGKEVAHVSSYISSWPDFLPFSFIS